MSLHADRVRDLKVLTDGLCTIISVTGLSSESRCIGELRTDLSEVYAIFAVAVMVQAVACQKRHDRVRLTVRVSQAGHRYVTKITRLDQSRDPTPCVSCNSLAPRVAATPEIPEHFKCGSCSLLMFLEPITRSYAP